MGNPILRILRDARFECDMATAEVQEGNSRIHLTHDPSVRDSAIGAYLTEREAIALASVLHAAVDWLRTSPDARKPGPVA